MADQQAWNAWKQFEQSGRVADYIRYLACRQQAGREGENDVQAESGEPTDAFENTGNHTAT